MSATPATPATPATSATLSSPSLPPLSSSPLSSSPRQLRPAARGHILLSHAPEQAAEVTELARSLVALGMTPFLSQDVLCGRVALSSARYHQQNGRHRRRFRPGQRRHSSSGGQGTTTGVRETCAEVPLPVRSLLEVVQNAAVVIVCLSPDYCASAECRFQVELARKHGRRLIPVAVQSATKRQQQQWQGHSGASGPGSSGNGGIALEQPYTPSGWLLSLFGGLRILDLTDHSSSGGTAGTAGGVAVSQAGGGAGGSGMHHVNVRTPPRRSLNYHTLEGGSLAAAAAATTPGSSFTTSGVDSVGSSSSSSSSSQISGSVSGSSLQMLVWQIEHEYEDLRQQLLVSLDRENIALRAELAAMMRRADAGSDMDRQHRRDAAVPQHAQHSELQSEPPSELQPEP